MTALTVWQPFRELTSFTEQVDQVFRNIFPESDSLEQSLLATSAVTPKVDIYEHDDHLMMEIEVPGMREEDLKISLDGTTLSISGERKKSEHSTKGRLQRTERTYGSFTRSFVLPSTVDPNSIQARYEQGVLHIGMAKKSEARPRQIPLVSHPQSGRTNKQITASTA